MAGFIFGGNTGETQESLKRKRSVADALAARASTAPKNVGEGLNALGNALVYRALMSKVEAGDATGRNSASLDAAALYGAPSPVVQAVRASPATSYLNTLVPMTDAAGEVAASSPDVSPSGTGNVYDDFIGTVQAGGVKNPYALAAIAATGDAESGFNAANVNRTWSDPSESGKPGTAGGIMSWRGPRYQALAATGDLSPAGQAKFFLKEDPSLIASLNSAKSVEEAQQLMNRAWAFAGHDRPGGETARRMKLANSYLPRFQGGNTEVASLDPSAGMSAASAIDAAATPSGYVDPGVDAQPATPAFDMGRFAPNINLAEMPPSRADIAPQMQRQTATLGGPSPVASALMSPAPQPAAGSSVVAALSNPAQAPAQPSPVAAALASPKAQPQEVAQANNTYFPAPPSPPAQNGPSTQQIMRVLNNPYSSEADKAYAASLLERQQKMADPAYQLDIETKRAQLDALRGKPTKTWQKLDDTTLFNPETGETQRVNAPVAGPGQFRFEGKSVEAQALNGLMEAGQLTPDQAQQLGAGKTITGPNGEIMFLTPQGVFGKSSQDAPAVPMSSGGATAQAPTSVDIFGDAPAGNAAPALGNPPTPPAPPSPPQPPQAPQRSGMIPLTEPKVTIDESKAGGFSDRMVNALRDLEPVVAAGSSWQGSLGNIVSDNGYIPDAAESYLMTDEYQRFDQARRNFINAQMRRESGAVISPEEFANANKQYFPMPGDSEETLKQKARSRQDAVNGMIRDAGPTYKAPAASAAASGAPAKGTVEGGYRFKGGDPADQSNWEKVQ